MAVLWGDEFDEIHNAGSVETVRSSLLEEIEAGAKCCECDEAMSFPAVYWAVMADPPVLFLHPECAFKMACGLLLDRKTVGIGYEAVMKNREFARMKEDRFREAMEALHTHKKTVSELEKAVELERGLREQAEQERKTLNRLLSSHTTIDRSPAIQPLRLDPLRNFTKEQRREIWRRSNGHCVICGNDLGNDWEADHIHPYSKGGKTEVVNGQALCRPCNSRKRAKVLTVDGGDQ